jgi:hypothetical protein
MNRSATLADTGPLVALINRNDPHHARYAEMLGSLKQTLLVTTWPCVTEAMHLLFRGGGHPAQDELWGYLIDDLVTIHDLSAAETARMRVLMAKYDDRPMDLADASLIVTAETLRASRIFTIDRDSMCIASPMAAR